MEKARAAVTRVKNLLARNSSSPFSDELPPPSSGGVFFHHHTSLAPNEKPPRYVQFGITPVGKLVTYMDPPVGFLTCSCMQESHNLSLPRHFSFITNVNNPANLTEEHVVSSKIVLQSLTQSQQLSSDISYLFFRLDGDEPQNSLEDLKSHVEAYLRSLTQGGDHAYETLYTTMFEASAPLASPVPREIGRRSQSRSSSSSDDDTSSPPEGSTVSKKSTLQFAILIFNADGQQLSFNLPWARYISETVQLQLGKEIAKGIKARKASCLAIYVVRDLNTRKVRYQICASTMSNEEWSQLQLTYKAQRCEGITYTVVPLKDLLKQELHQTYCKALAETLADESLYRWFQKVIKLILSESLFFACDTCNATFEEKTQVERHSLRVHGNRLSSTDSSDLETEMLIRSAKQRQWSQGRGSSRQRRLEHDSRQEGQGFASRGRGRNHHNDRHDDHHSRDHQRRPGHHQHNARPGDGDRIPSHPGPPPILSDETYQPRFLADENSPPKEYLIFWNLRGFSSLSSDKETPTKGICPKFPKRMLSLETLVNYPSMLEEESLAWFKVYRYMFTQETFSSIEKVDILAIHAYNDPKRLQASGRSKTFEDLRRAAPCLESKTLKSLSEAALENFFFQARLFVLTHHIPVECFPDYILTAQTMGIEIHNRIKETLAGYPEFRSVLKRFSVYLESIIRALLPAQEPYSQCEQRIISEHRVYLLSSHPSVDYTRTKLHADASELLMRSPHYVQTRDSMSIDQKRSHVDGLKTNLLSKIVAETPFEADLYRLVTMDQQYRKLEEIPFQTLLDRLQNLILADQRGDAAQANAVSSRSRSRLVRSTGESRRASRSPQPSQPVSERKSSQKSRSRSKSPHISLQHLCDLCSKFDLPETFCQVNKHCRVKDHQPDFKGSVKKFYQAMHSPETFVVRDDCRKCLSPEAGADYKWVRKSSQPVNQEVSIPSSFFKAPYSLHPQSVQDIARQGQAADQRHHPSLYDPQQPLDQGRASQAPLQGQSPRSSRRANSPRR